MSKVILKALIQNMAKDEVTSLIPKEVLERIKTQDSKPEFRVYSIGHEGEARGREIGYGSRLMQYFKNAISQIAEKVKLGTSFFLNHNSDNSTQSRESIGEVVGKTLKTLEGNLHALAIAYIKPAFRNLNLDIASFEGDVEFIESKNGASEALNIHSVTGIALGDSRFAQPAFAGATLLATVQNFTLKGGDMTPEEIKKLIEEKGYTPDLLFSPEKLVEVKAVKEVIAKSKQTEYEHAKRVEKLLAEERGNVLKLTEEREGLSKKVADMNQIVNTTRAESIVSESFSTRKLNDSQKSFILKHKSKFNSSKEGEELKVEVGKFIDEQLKEFDEYAKILGIKPEGTKGQMDRSTGNGDKDKSDDLELGSELLDPAKNDLIPSM